MHLHVPFTILLLNLIPTIYAQVSLPKPPILPPDAADGANPSPASQATPNPQWSSLLGNLIYFYEAQRSGRLPNTNRVSWRNDSCVQDGKDVGLDLSGGYYDAGDYIKCTFPLSFTVMQICWGALDYGKGYDMAKQTPYLDDMLRWSLGWLMKAHPENNTLYVQVGDGNLKDAYWGGDRAIPQNRPSYQINSTSPGTDVAGITSAAFSACSALYGNKKLNDAYPGPASLQNETYARLLFGHAQSLHTFATTASGGRKKYQDSVPQISGVYNSGGYYDDLVISTLFLSIAEGSQSRFKEAESLYHKYQLSGKDEVFNWDSKTPGLAVLFAQAAKGFGESSSTWNAEAERYFDKLINHQGRSFMTPGGLLFYGGDSDNASLNPALNAAMLLARYAVIGSPNKKDGYLKFAQSQVDYVLGDNPMSMPYIVGANPNSPQNPHSAMASGGSDITKINTSPEKEAYILYGAVVGGPNRHDKFYDIRSDWPETEVALDYNAPMVTLAAMNVAGNSQDPFYTKLKAGEYNKRKPSGHPCDSAFGCNQGLPKGAKIAIGVSITVVGLCIIGLVVAWIHRARRNSKA